ncbi:hypothetical protein B0H19DRAFT_1038328 [Mycena capillaripes]|nr:hypothetical protein B0H19DRAFT_1038328 [Mycena capillaripes]
MYMTCLPSTRRTSAHPTDVFRASMVLVAHCSPLVALTLDLHDSFFGKSHLNFGSAPSHPALSLIFTFPLSTGLQSPASCLPFERPLLSTSHPLTSIDLPKCS